MITFRGGVHPYDGKEYTKDKQIEKLEASQEVVFLMKQHIGAPSIPVVKAKDEVHVEIIHRIMRHMKIILIHLLLKKR